MDETLDSAERNGIVRDVIMWNGAVDAYVECGRPDRAAGALEVMLSGSRGDRTTEEDGVVGSRPIPPPPNVRTYNTVLKGYASAGDLGGAMDLTARMELAGFWDDISTNTLVKAAVAAKDLRAAESILDDRTATGGGAPHRGGSDGGDT